MNLCNKTFTAGFLKVAAPAWFYEMNKTMNPLKSMKNYSTVGLKSTSIGKKLK